MTRSTCLCCWKPRWAETLWSCYTRAKRPCERCQSGALIPRAAEPRRPQLHACAGIPGGCASWLSGELLRCLPQRGHPPPLGHAWKCAQSCLESSLSAAAGLVTQQALEYLHERSIVHRCLALVTAHGLAVSALSTLFGLPSDVHWQANVQFIEQC